jgi:hypothetical protein
VYFNVFYYVHGKDFVFRMWAWTSQEINEALVGAAFNAQPLFG